MVERSLRDLPGVVESSERARSFFSHRRRRRVFAAFLLGAPLAAAAWLIVQPGGRGAAAHGPSAGAVSTFFSNPGGFAPSAIDAGAALDASPERKHKKMDASASLASRRSVCVRLCDGFFFPVAPLSGRTDLASHEAACEDNCPDAPTALYIEPSGSDKIEDAVSTSGAPYTALPVALRSRTTLDNTCACHRAASRRYNYALLRDFTLRKGDAVMTPKGFMVFQGRKRLPFARKDFIALTQAPMPSDNRAALVAMERASATNGATDNGGASLTPPRPERLSRQ